eukprot:scaffold434683_cov33-Prasinocladus_malaysianus.AAC.1
MAASIGRGGGGGGVEGILQRAKMLERSRDWGRAIDAYMEVTTASAGVDGAQQAWAGAVKVAVEHLPHRSQEVVNLASSRLVEARRHDAAAGLHMKIDDAAGAVRVYLKAQMWEKARNAAAGNARLEELVDSQSRQHMVSAGDAAGLASSGASDHAIEMYAKQGEWNKVHELAAKEGADVVARYTLRHAKMKAQQGDFHQAAGVLARYGVQPNPDNFDLYKHVARSVLSESRAGMDGGAYADTRDYLQKVVQQMEATPDVNPVDLDQFRRLYQAAHLSSQFAVCAKQGWAVMAAKAATALLRHIGDVPADK